MKSFPSSTTEHLHHSSSSSSNSRPGAAAGIKKSVSLPPETVEYLKAWMMSPEHIAHPYPTEQEKAQIRSDTGIELKQLTNWFVNNRKRYWKPRIEQDKKVQKQWSSSSSSSNLQVHAGSRNNTHSAGKTLTTLRRQQAANDETSSTMICRGASVAARRGLVHHGHGTEHLSRTEAHTISEEGSRSSSICEDYNIMDDDGDDEHDEAVLPPEEEDDSTQDVSSSNPSDSEDASSSSSPASPTSAPTPQNNRHPPFPSRRATKVIRRTSSTRGTTAAEDDNLEEEEEEDDDNNSHRMIAPRKGSYVRQEEVDLFIVRPERSNEGDHHHHDDDDNDDHHHHEEETYPLPTLRDLTIRPYVPRDRILATFKCPISYEVPYEIEHDKRKIQSRRDNEILRMKKHYLKLYLATRGICTTSATIMSPKIMESTTSSSSSSSSQTMMPPFLSMSAKKEEEEEEGHHVVSTSSLPSSSSMSKGVAMAVTPPSSSSSSVSSSYSSYPTTSKIQRPFSIPFHHDMSHLPEEEEEEEKDKEGRGGDEQIFQSQYSTTKTTTPYTFSSSLQDVNKRIANKSTTAMHSSSSFQWSKDHTFSLRRNSSSSGISSSSSSSSSTNTLLGKRACTTTSGCNLLLPRGGEDEWRRRCMLAKHFFCETLPGLEEASYMFGYCNSICKEEEEEQVVVVERDRKRTILDIN